MSRCTASSSSALSNLQYTVSCGLWLPAAPALTAACGCRSLLAIINAKPSSHQVGNAHNYCHILKTLKGFYRRQRIEHRWNGRERREIEQCTFSRAITTLIQSRIGFAFRAGNKNSFSSRRMDVATLWKRGKEC